MESWSWLNPCQVPRQDAKTASSCSGSLPVLSRSISGPPDLLILSRACLRPTQQQRHGREERPTKVSETREGHEKACSSIWPRMGQKALDADSQHLTSTYRKTEGLASRPGVIQHRRKAV